MSKLIDRQQAIDALDNQIKQCCKALGSFSLSDADKHAVEVEMASLRACRGMLENLPTIQPEPTDIDAREAVYNLAEKIGIHQLFALTVGLRGEPIQPEPHEGHWIDKGWDGDWAWQIDGRGNCWRVIECSECGKSVSVESNYCPNCGADMRGEKDG